MPNNKARETRIIESVTNFGITVDIKARKGQRNLVLEYEIGSDRVRKSARTEDLNKAKAKATVLVRELAKAQLGHELGIEVPADGNLDLKTLFQAFRAIRVPQLKDPRPGLTASYKGQLDVAMRALSACFGDSYELSHFDQNAIARFVSWRATPRNRAKMGVRAKGGVPPTEKTAARDLSLFGEIVNWAMCTKIKGKPLLLRSPILGLSLPSPKANRVQPVNSELRMAALRRAAPVAERIARENNCAENHAVPGYFSLFLELLADLGHRVSATGMLQRQDVLRSPAEVARVAARYGLEPETCARVWRWGAIHFRAGNDKLQRASLIPLSRRMRRRLDEHLGLMDQMGRISPQAYLLCMPTDPCRPLMGSSAQHVLREIERQAVLDGRPLEHLERGMAHPLRRRFRSIRAGRFDDALVAVAGGWTLAGAGADASAMNVSYLKFPPESLLHCIEFDPIRDLDQDSCPPGVKIRVKLDRAETATAAMAGVAMDVAQTRQAQPFLDVP